LDCTAEFRVSAVTVEFRNTSRRCEQRRQMTTRGVTDRSDVVSVDAEFFRIGSQESNGRFAVVNVSGENRFSAQAIINGRRHVAFRREGLSDIAMVDLCSFPLAAAMNADDRRQLLRRILRTKDVHLQSSVAVLCERHVKSFVQSIERGLGITVFPSAPGGLSSATPGSPEAIQRKPSKTARAMCRWGIVFIMRFNLESG
jgi:hypothetical protein